MWLWPRKVLNPNKAEKLIQLIRRAGLFIVDLENPLNVPAFLPQGGMSVSVGRQVNQN